MESFFGAIQQLFCTNPRRTPPTAPVLDPDNRKPVREVYKLQKEIGSGAFGTVCTATRKADQAKRAVKTISKAIPGKVADSHQSSMKIRCEVKAMKCLDHPGIVKLYETFEDAKNVYLIMELCVGGELFDRISAQGHFKESQAAIVMKQIIGAIYYMHKNRICHRDLKPENFLFSSKGAIENNTLKLVDFGLAVAFAPGGVNMSTMVGTPLYVAPQVLDGRYDELCDVWSCGVIMYVLLCGYPPFYHPDSDREILRLVKLGRYSYDAHDWARVSLDARNLIDGMLAMDPSARYSAMQAYSHVWVREKAPRAENTDLPSGMLDKLRTFSAQNRLKQAALQVIAGLLSENKIKGLRDMFKSLDANGDGMLSAAELEAGIHSAGIADIPGDLRQIFRDLDTDDSGHIDYSEFLAAALDKKTYIQDDVCWSAFCAFDKDGNGKISRKELLGVLKANNDISSVMGQPCVDEAIAEVDKDRNGEIDFQEFMQMMRHVSK